jgi:hypothetical protein
MWKRRSFSANTLLCSYFMRVSDGTRTRDRLDHNQELYLLSYAHHVPPGRATFGI